MKDTVLIVGTGLAALASAIRLNEAGYYVEIIEKNDKPGGRLG